MQDGDADVMVTGGTGLIGRWLLAELTRNRQVVAVVRGARRRGDELRSFVGAHGGDGRRLVVVEGDVEVPGLGLGDAFAGVRDVYHVAARFAFRLDADAARRTNVQGSLHVAAWAKARRSLRRFVYLGGYRMVAPSSPLHDRSFPMSDDERARLYREHGGYEASKHESFLAIRDYAAKNGLPWTAVHPSSVIGNSATGETTQTTGFGDLVERLHAGRLPALVGSKRTFLPLVTVDYLARVLATVPEREETEGQDLCVLDPRTRELPDLVAHIAHHVGVAAPTRVLSPRLVGALPTSLTGIEPESLRFLSEERYDVRAAEAHASAIGLVRPPIERSVERWASFLISTRFGKDPSADRGELREGAFCVGDPDDAEILYLHGLPWNGDAWKPVAESMAGPHARVDLPGLGRSAPTELDDVAWLDRLLSKRTRPIVLAGHSLGAGLAVRYAHVHPDRVAGLALVSPAFLQKRGGLMLRLPPLVSMSLRRGEPATLAARLIPEIAPGEVERSAAWRAIVSTCTDLRRRGVARRTARALANASGEPVRSELRRQLEEVAAPVIVLHGDRDPLLFATRHRVHTIANSGHNPHLSQPEAVTRLMHTFAAEARDRSVGALGRVLRAGVAGVPSRRTHDVLEAG